MVRVDPAVAALGGVAAYNVVQNLAVPERAYVPANLAFAAGLIAVARRSGMRYEAMGLGPRNVGSGLRLGTIAAASIGAVLGAVTTSPRFGRWFLDRRAYGHAAGEALYRSVVRFPLGTALFEEVVFRGVLDGLWRRRVGTRPARLVCATAFGLWHLIPTYRDFPLMAAGESNHPTQRVVASVVGALLTGPAGIGFAMLRERSGSVVAPWLAHAAFNSGSYLAARHAWSRQSGGSVTASPPGDDVEGAIREDDVVVVE